MKSLKNLHNVPAGEPLLADEVLEFHAARLMLLIRCCGVKSKADGTYRIDGLTKMAKLDFFVRYPKFFAEVCKKLNVSVSQINDSTESTMVRFHYGPWDQRYYHILAYLEGRQLLIGDTQHRIARRWKEAGNKTKVFVDDNGMSADDLSHFLMEQLGIPMLHYPQGNPMGPRTWPELTWRSLYRHIYRRQRFWADLADQQPESEQHACILQFTGLAQYLFSDEFGNLVKSQKRIMDLQTRKEQFVEMLQEVSKDIVDEPGMAVALTPESLKGAIQQLENKTTEIAARRDNLLRSVAATAAGSIPDHPPAYEKMTDDLARFKSAEAASTQQFRRAEDRLVEIKQYQQTIQNELARLQRAQSAGRLLADLKVTHCPACDQEIKRKDEHTSVCYVCGQNNPIDDATTENATKRLAFEVEQLEAESKESNQLVAALEKERAQTLSERTRTRHKIQQLESELRPIQTAAAQIMPAEFSIYDMESGRLQERVKQLRRIEIALSKRETNTSRLRRFRPR